MNHSFGNSQVTCRPILGCFILVIFCGLFSILAIPTGTIFAMFAGEFGQMGEVRSDIQEILESDPRVQDKLGTPVDYKILQSSSSFSVEENIRTGSYESPIEGPRGSGTIFAEFKKVGEEISYTELKVVTQDEQVIDLLAK